VGKGEGGGGTASQFDCRQTNPYLSNTWHGRRFTTTDCKGSIKHDTNLEGSNTKREVEIKEEVEVEVF
jgi:hypothetical protein